MEEHSLARNTLGIGLMRSSVGLLEARNKSKTLVAYMTYTYARVPGAGGSDAM